MVQLLEAKAVINGKFIYIINTEMDIKVIIDSNNKIKSVRGHFSYETETFLYKKKSTIKFSSDESWKYDCKYEDMPEIALINFDEKLIQLK